MALNSSLADIQLEVIRLPELGQTYVEGVELKTVELTVYAQSPESTSFDRNSIADIAINSLTEIRDLPLRR